MLHVIPYVWTDDHYELSAQPDPKWTLIDAPNFWYLHGVLQNQLNYDKAEVYVDDIDLKWNTDIISDISGSHNYLKEGVYDAQVSGYANRFRGFFWIKKEGESIIQRGLVVDPDVKKDLDYAEKKFVEKPVVM